METPHVPPEHVDHAALAQAEAEIAACPHEWSNALTRLDAATVRAGGVRLFLAAFDAIREAHENVDVQVWNVKALYNCAAAASASPYFAQAYIASAYVSGQEATTRIILHMLGLNLWVPSNAQLEDITREVFTMWTDGAPGEWAVLWRAWMAELQPLGMGCDFESAIADGLGARVPPLVIAGNGVAGWQTGDEADTLACLWDVESMTLHGPSMTAYVACRGQRYPFVARVRVRTGEVAHVRLVHPPIAHALAVANESCTALLGAVGATSVWWLDMERFHCVCIAGSPAPGMQNGLGDEAQFSNITAIVALTDGSRAFVSDSANRQVRMLSLHGSAAAEVTTLVGTGDFASVDGPLAVASFRTPTALALSFDESELFVADAIVVRVVALATRTVRTLRSDRLVSRNQFDALTLTSLAVDFAGTIFVVTGDRVERYRGGAGAAHHSVDLTTRARLSLLPGRGHIAVTSGGHLLVASQHSLVAALDVAAQAPAEFAFATFRQLRPFARQLVVTLLLIARVRTQAHELDTARARFARLPDRLLERLIDWVLRGR